MKKNNRRKIKNNSGFTLIEMVIVVVFVSVTFIAIYQLFASTIKQDTESRYEIIASNLAQEGVEMIRNMRDENELNNEDIDQDIGSSCRPVANSNGIVSCSGSSDNICLISGRYQYFSSCSEQFKRICAVTDDGASPPKQMEVKCTVTWKSFVNPSLPRTATAKSVMTDWQPND